MCHLNKLLEVVPRVHPTRFLIFFIVCFICQFMSSGYAATGQDEVGKINQEYIDACKNTINLATTKLTPALKKYPGIIEPDKKLVLLMPAANFDAFADYQRLRVLIPVMVCIETWFAIDAIAQVQFKPYLRDDAMAYFRYLNRRQRDSMRSGLFDSIDIKPFYIYAKVLPLDFSSPEGARMHAILEDEMLSAMAFLVGHEVGHLALKHKPYDAISNEESRKQETAADMFSIELLNETGISLIPALAVLERMLTAEIQFGRDASTATHPSAECRTVRILESSRDFENMLRDPKLQRQFETASGRSVAEYRSAMSDAKQRCGIN